MEATVKHFDAVYTYQQYTNLVTSLGTNLNGLEIAGLCFRPIRLDGMGGNGNYTDQIEAVLVAVEPPQLEAGGSTTPGGLRFFTSNSGGEAESVSTADTIASSIDLDELSGWQLVHFYDGTSEFEYAFIDLPTFEYLANPNSHPFYKHNAGGEPIDASNVVIQSGSRGLLLSRAFLDMHDGTDYVEFRALRMAPYPEPPLLENANRASIAYYVGPICPPIWRNIGTEPFEAEETPPSGDSGSRLVSRPMMARQSDPAPDKTDLLAPDPAKGGGDCNCIVNKINLIRVHNELIKQGIIPKEPPVAYRVPFGRKLLVFLMAFLRTLGGQRVKYVHTVVPTTGPQIQVN